MFFKVVEDTPLHLVLTSYFFRFCFLSFHTFGSNYLKLCLEATFAPTAPHLPESKAQVISHKDDEPPRSNKKLQQPEDEQLPAAQPRPGPELDPTVAALGANQLAVSIVTGVVLLAVIAVSCHMYRKKGSWYLILKGPILYAIAGRYWPDSPSRSPIHL